MDTGYEETVRAQRQRYEVGRSAQQRDPGDEPDIVFNEDIGLACERLPEGLTTDQLWRIA